MVLGGAELHSVGPVEVESINARAVAERVREAIEATVDELTPAERTAVARRRTSWTAAGTRLRRR